MDDYDAGLLGDFGGGNVEWWHDYLRAEIGRANEHWSAQVAALEAERDRCIDANIDLLHERDQLLNEIQLITAPHDSVGAVIAGIRAERDQLRAELAEAKRNGYIIAMRIRQSSLLIDDLEGSALQSFLTREAIYAALAADGENNNAI